MFIRVWGKYILPYIVLNIMIKLYNCSIPHHGSQCVWLTPFKVIIMYGHACYVQYGAVHFSTLTYMNIRISLDLCVLWYDICWSSLILVNLIFPVNRQDIIIVFCYKFSKFTFLHYLHTFRTIIWHVNKIWQTKYWTLFGGDFVEIMNFVCPFFKTRITEVLQNTINLDLFIK